MDTAKYRCNRLRVLCGVVGALYGVRTYILYHGYSKQSHDYIEPSTDKISVVPRYCIHCMTASNQVNAYTYNHNGCNNQETVFCIIAFYSAPFPCGAFLWSVTLCVYIIYHTIIHYHASIFASLIYIRFTPYNKSDRAATIPHKHKEKQHKRKKTNTTEQRREAQNRRKQEATERLRTLKACYLLYTDYIRAHARSVSVKPSASVPERSKKMAMWSILHIISIICDFFRVSGCFSRFWIPRAPERRVALPSVHLIFISALSAGSRSSPVSHWCFLASCENRFSSFPRNIFLAFELL